MESEIYKVENRTKNFSHALTVFTIATSVACLFAPVFEIGIAHSLIFESKDLALEKQSLIEKRNKLSSDVSKLQTPEELYNIAFREDYKLELIQPSL